MYIHGVGGEGSGVGSVFPYVPPHVRAHVTRSAPAPLHFSVHALPTTCQAMPARPRDLVSTRVLSVVDGQSCPKAVTRLQRKQHPRALSMFVL